LLPGNFLLQRRILQFKLSQSPDIGTVGGADEVGEHVHLAENTADKIFRRLRVCQDRPIPSRYLCLINRVRPKGAYLLDIARLAELRNRDSVPAIQGLLQELGWKIPLPGQKDGANVKRVIGFLVYSRQLHLDEDLP